MNFVFEVHKAVIGVFTNLIQTAYLAHTNLILHKKFTPYIVVYWDHCNKLVPKTI